MATEPAPTVQRLSEFNYDGGGGIILFSVKGSSDVEAARQAAVTAAMAIQLGACAYQDAQIAHRSGDKPDDYLVTARYGGPKAAQPRNCWTIRGRDGGDSARMTHALEHVADYQPGDEAEIDHQGALGTPDQPSQGVDVPVGGSERFTLIGTVDVLTDTILGFLCGIRGCINDDDWQFVVLLPDWSSTLTRTFGERECRIESYSYGPRSQGDWEIQLEVYRVITADVVYDEGGAREITMPGKAGQHYAWTEDRVSTTGDGLHKVNELAAAHEERLSPLADYSAINSTLGLPAPEEE
jgi:hypothetical protein